LLPFRIMQDSRLKVELRTVADECLVKKLVRCLQYVRNVDVLKLSLSVFKREDFNDYSGRNNIRFAVVDLERSEEYPVNFVCILPKQIKANGRNHTKFERKFGDESLDLAEKLLERSLKAENDWEVKEEIRERLELLKEKPQRTTRKKRPYFHSYKNYY
jgi:hypothetical protein